MEPLKKDFIGRTAISFLDCWKRVRSLRGRHRVTVCTRLSSTPAYLRREPSPGRPCRAKYRVGRVRDAAPAETKLTHLRLTGPRDILFSYQHVTSRQQTSRQPTRLWRPGTFIDARSTSSDCYSDGNSLTVRRAKIHASRVASLDQHPTAITVCDSLLDTVAHGCPSVVQPPLVSLTAETQFPRSPHKEPVGTEQVKWAEEPCFCHGSGSLWRSTSDDNYEIRQFVARQMHSRNRQTAAEEEHIGLGKQEAMERGATNASTRGVSEPRTGSGTWAGPFLMETGTDQ